MSTPTVAPHPDLPQYYDVDAGKRPFVRKIFDDTAGTYSMTVAPNTWAMTYVPAYSFTNGDSLLVVAAPTPATAVVASGGSATVNYSITSATCKPKA